MIKLINLHATVLFWSAAIANKHYTISTILGPILHYTCFVNTDSTVLMAKRQSALVQAISKSDVCSFSESQNYCPPSAIPNLYSHPFAYPFIPYRCSTLRGWWAVYDELYSSLCSLSTCSFFSDHLLMCEGIRLRSIVIAVLPVLLQNKLIEPSCVWMVETAC